MSKVNNGGPAFPELGNVGYNSDWQSESGMTLRDYFVANIIVSKEDYSNEIATKLVGRSIPKWSEDPMWALIFWAEFKAIVRGIEADAMIAEREKR